jgi:parallel beta-helix repeat protein
MVVAGNTFGTVVKPADLRSVQTIAGTASTDNEFRDNVVAGQTIDGVDVINSDQNLFIHNNLSGNGGVGLNLLTSNNMVRHNTVDSNDDVGISAAGSGNTIDDNTTLGNLGNLVNLRDVNGDCTHNTWTDNSFNSNSVIPDCIQ